MLALWTCAAAAIVHASFGRAHALELFRQWASSKDQLTTLVRARIALEHPSSFLITSVSDDDAMVAYVCLPVGPEVCRIDAVVWSDGTADPERFRALRRWHADVFQGKTILVPGRLEPADLFAWDHHIQS